MIRGRRRVQLIKVSVLPRACLVAAASPACVVCASFRPGRAGGNKFPGPLGEGALEQTRVTLTLGSDLLARVRMRP